MTLKTLMAAAGLTAVAVMATVPAALAQQLQPIGSITYEVPPLAVQTNTFQIKNADSRIRAMRILAERGSAEVRSLKVIYENGSSETVPVRQNLKEGERTATLEFRNVRPIRAIDVAYVPKGNVRLVLLADSQDAAPPPAQWVELACRNVGFLVDRDVANISTKDTFKSLRLRSANYDIDMIEMTVRFGNGSRDTYNIRSKIPAGGRIGPIDLRGERRNITQLEFVYRTRTIGNVKTQLCVDGLK